MQPLGKDAVTALPCNGNPYLTACGPSGPDASSPVRHFPSRWIALVLAVGLLGLGPAVVASDAPYTVHFAVVRTGVPRRPLAVSGPPVGVSSGRAGGIEAGLPHSAAVVMHPQSARRPRSPMGTLVQTVGTREAPHAPLVALVLLTLCALVVRTSRRGGAGGPDESGAMRMCAVADAAVEPPGETGPPPKTVGPPVRPPPHASAPSGAHLMSSGRPSHAAVDALRQGLAAASAKDSALGVPCGAVLLPCRSIDPFRKGLESVIGGIRFKAKPRRLTGMPRWTECQTEGGGRPPEATGLPNMAAHADHRDVLGGGGEEGLAAAATACTPKAKMSHRPLHAALSVYAPG